MLRKLFYAVIALVSIPYLANSQGYDWNYPPPPTTSSLWAGSSCPNISPWIAENAYLPDESDRPIWQPITLKVNLIFWTNPNLPNGDVGNFNPTETLRFLITK